VITEAADVLAGQAGVLEFGVGGTGVEAGLPWGGAISIYVEPPRRERSTFSRQVFQRAARGIACRAHDACDGERRLFDAGVPMSAEIAQCLNSVGGLFLSL
jgi:xanthine dehydrogenase accessory factor